MDNIEAGCRKAGQFGPQETAREQEHQPTVQNMQQQIDESKTGRPPLPNRVLQGVRKYRQWPVDSAVELSSPVGLKKKVQRLNAADLFVCCDYENIIENECIP